MFVLENVFENVRVEMVIKRSRKAEYKRAALWTSINTLLDQSRLPFSAKALEKPVVSTSLVADISGII